MPFVLDKRKDIVLLPIPLTQLEAMKILGKLANQSPIFLVSGVLYEDSFESVVRSSCWQLIQKKPCTRPRMKLH